MSGMMQRCGCAQYRKRVVSVEGLERRIRAALALHEPAPICTKHFQADDCGEPRMFRCFICRQTRPQPCRTWRALTDKDMP